MLDLNALKAEMVRNGYNQETLANAIGLSPRTLSTRFKTGDFGTKEIEKLTEVLNIKNPWKIFFA